MGSFDIYCLLCGGPFNNKEIIKDNTLLKKHISKGKYYGINPDGWWADIMGLIERLKISDEEKKKLLKNIYINKEYDWLKNVIDISKDNIKKIDYYDIDLEKDHYFIHKSCHTLLKNNGIIINYDVLHNIKGIKYNLFNKNYGIITKYQGQFFYQALAHMENDFLLENPLKNNKNASRILELVNNNMKISKSTKVRPSPSVSATLFKINTIRKGNDGNMWIVKEVGKSVRWVKYKK